MIEKDSITMEKDCYTIWENCLRIIKNNTNEQTYLTWFEPIVPFSLNGNVLKIKVPSRFFCEYLEENYVSLLTKAIVNSLGKDGKLEYVIKQEEEEEASSSKTYITNLSKTNSGNQHPSNNGTGNYSKNTYEKQKEIYNNFKLNTQYTFDNFIEGDCNRLARSAGLAVARKPGITSFNPLMLYGGVGLGKTHLIQAIGNYILKHQAEESKKEVLYVSSDTFTNHFIESLKNNSLDQFNHFYMQVDVLMIDDVQFLAGKDKTQEIFFHIFNHLHQSGKQIIMTSDCPPIELKGLEERLLSRFKWGLTADLKQPDLETRMAIIQKKLQDALLQLPDDVIEYLANSIDSNVRELEGAINSLIAQASLNKLMIDLDLAKQTVQKIVQSAESKELSIDEVQKLVSEYFGLSVDDLKAKTRKKEIVIARQVAMYFAKEFTGFSLKSIGYHFGGRDHSTVIHAIQCINDMIVEKKEMKMCIEDLGRKLKKKSSIL